MAGQYYYTPYLLPYYQQPVLTPFIPPTVSLPPSPNAGAGSRRVHFEDEDPDPYRTGRPRPTSWNSAPQAVQPTVFPSPPLIYTPLPPVVPLGPPAPGYTHHRRRSDTNLPQPAWVSVPTWVVRPQTPEYPPQINPLICGERIQGPMILFDLSQSAYKPLKVTSPSATHGTALTADEETQTATHPGVTRMVITCDEIPGFEVILEPQNSRATTSGYLGVPDTTPTPPITVHDVLFAIHKKLQQQIRHRDWVALSSDQATAVARAYTRRCRTFPSVQAFEESQGVRWVDYLLDKYMFKGITRQRGERGFEKMRLIVGRR